MNLNKRDNNIKLTHFKHYRLLIRLSLLDRNTIKAGAPSITKVLY